jgi:hypothetical protein
VPFGGLGVGLESNGWFLISLYRELTELNSSWRSVEEPQTVSDLLIDLLIIERTPLRCLAVKAPRI